MAKRQTMVILSNGTSEVVEKKSRFIGALYKAESEQEVNEYIAAVRKKYWDARHHCYAFILGDGGELQRCSDDGEPAGTAGKPILEVLAGSGVRNALLIVTRYFGGTLLGTGGLVRAYSQAARQAIDSAVIAVLVEAVKVSLVTDYNNVGPLQYMAAKEKLVTVDTVYTDKVELVLAFERERLATVVKQLEQITRGQGSITVDGAYILGRDKTTGQLFVI